MTPLVSCLCVSSNRPKFLKNTIQSFLAQKYECKELIIVSSDTNEAYSQIIESHHSSNTSIKYFPLDGSRKLTLGELRNFSISKATGDFMCNWDDDDWSHEKRLEIQVRQAVRNSKKASVLAYCLIHDAINNRSYLSRPFFHPATILFHRCLIDKQTLYPSQNLQEDLEFFLKLNAKNAVMPIIDPSLYVYVFHGGNTWNSSHFTRFFNRSQPLSDKTSQLIKTIVSFEVSVDKASRLLHTSEFLAELDYLGWFDPSRI